PAMCTALGPMVMTCSLPLTRLPDADARLTTALCSSTGAAGSGAGAGVVLQAASPATRQAAARGAILAIRMALLLVGETPAIVHLRDRMARQERFRLEPSFRVRVLRPRPSLAAASPRWPPVCSSATSN